jgi:hypothetical protein
MDYFPASGLRALVSNMMFEKARDLSAPQALEVWRSIQLVETGGPLVSVSRPALQLAMDFNRFPPARKLVEQKAIAHERAARVRNAIHWLGLER